MREPSPENSRSPSRAPRRLALLTLLLLFPGCSDETVSPAEVAPDLPVVPPGTSPDTIATYSGGKVTQADLDAAILALPERDRSPRGTPAADWAETLVRKIVLQRLTEQNLEAPGNPLPGQLTDQLRKMRRALYSDHRLRQEAPKQLPVSDEEIAALYAKHQSLFARAESRMVYHIFLRAPEEADASAATAKLASLKQRVEAGENFGLLAEEFSESETRHERGSLGSVMEGDLPEPANSVVFSLDEGKVSDPVVTGDGVHLFFNENTTAGRTLGIDEVRSLLTRAIALEKALSVLAAVAAKEEVLADHFIPEGDQLKELLKEESPETLLLRIGTFRLTRAGLARAIAAQRQRQAPLWVFDDARVAVFGEIRDREILFQAMLAKDSPENQPIEEAYQAQRRNQLLSAQQRRDLTAWIEANPDPLRSYYEANSLRFQTLPRAKIRSVSFPFGKGASTKMAALEELKPALDRGSLTLDDVARTLLTKVEDWGWFNPPQLRQLDPDAARIAFGLEPGGYSHPYTGRERVILFQLEALETPKPIPFEVAFNDVLSSYLRDYGPKAYSEMAVELLDEKSFTYFPQHLPEEIARLE